MWRRSATTQTVHRDRRMPRLWVRASASRQAVVDKPRPVFAPKWWLVGSRPEMRASFVRPAFLEEPAAAPRPLKGCGGSCCLSWFGVAVGPPRTTQAGASVRSAVLSTARRALQALRHQCSGDECSHESFGLSAGCISTTRGLNDTIRQRYQARRRRSKGRFKVLAAGGRCVARGWAPGWVKRSVAPCRVRDPRFGPQVRPQDALSLRVLRDCGFGAVLNCAVEECERECAAHRGGGRGRRRAHARGASLYDEERLDGGELDRDRVRATAQFDGEWYSRMLGRETVLLGISADDAEGYDMQQHFAEVSEFLSSCRAEGKKVLGASAGERSRIFLQNVFDADGPCQA